MGLIGVGRAVGAVGAALVVASCGGAPPPLPAGAVPILFVHGHGTDSAVFDDMVDHLENRGYPAAYLLAIDLVPADGLNESAAVREIAPAVEELVARTGQGPEAKVDIVAHSMGALSSRWYATKVRPDRVRTLVTVGGANHGTDALCDFADPGGFELCPAFAVDPEHPVQTGLNGVPGAPADETPYGRGSDAPDVPTVAADGRRAIRYVTVSIPDDQWIRPPSSSLLDGADVVERLPDTITVDQPSPGNLVFRESTDHDLILQDDDFFVLLDSVLPGGAA